MTERFLQSAFAKKSKTHSLKIACKNVCKNSVFPNLEFWTCAAVYSFLPTHPCGILIRYYASGVPRIIDFWVSQ